MKEKLLKNLKAKGVHASTRYNELFATYPITDNLEWTDQFTIDKTTENTIDKTLWILNHLPEDILKRVTDVSTPSYHNLFLSSNIECFTVAIDYFKMNNILIRLTTDYVQCTINDFVIYCPNNTVTVSKSITSTKKTFKKDLEALLEEFNQLAQKGNLMDCSKINLKLTKDNFNPQALADYIEKHKNTILANYSEKYLDCLDVTLDITDQGIILRQIFKELKIRFRDHLKEEVVVYQKTTDLSFKEIINFNKFEPLIPIKDFINLLKLDNYIGVITYTSATDDDDYWDNDYKLKGVYTDLNKALTLFEDLKENHPYDLVLTLCQLDKDIDSPIYCYT